MAISTYQFYRCAREDINKRICALDTRINHVCTNEELEEIEKETEDDEIAFSLLYMQHA